jgi:hypothetical protein
MASLPLFLAGLLGKVASLHKREAPKLPVALMIILMEAPTPNELL